MRAPVFCLLLIMVGCSSPTVIQTDLTRQKGVYIVGYSPDAAVRRQFEDQLQADLGAFDMVGYASYRDIDDITRTEPQEVIRAAIERSAAAIVVINQVSNSVVADPQRIRPNHPTVTEFFDAARDYIGTEYPPSEEVVAEVNGFLVSNDEARLVWSGASMSFRGDGRGGAIKDISEAIAKGLSEARREMLE